MPPKVMFVTPIVSRRYASDWDGVSLRLAYTVQSLARQSCPNWKIMVIGSEMPALSDHLMQHVVFCKADLDIDDPASQGRREVDKERKLYCGFAELGQYDPEYVMPLDYDDLVSIRLVQYVAANPGIDGFILRRGYIYVDGTRHCRYSRRISMRTGSNLVVRYSSARHLFPTVRSDFAPPPSDYRNWPFVTSHVKRPDRHFASLGLSYRTVPFPAVIWRRNACSISNAFAASRRSTSRSLISRGLHSCREMVKDILFRRPVNTTLRAEFGCDQSGLGIYD